MADEPEKSCCTKSEKEEDTDFTAIVGGCGRWQWIIFVIYFVTCFPAAWHNLIMSFFAPNIEHWCARSDEAINANISSNLWKQEMIPAVLSEDGEIHYSRCERYDAKLNISLSTQKTEDGITGITNNSRKTVPCQKWEYADNFYSSTLVNEWDLVCDREWLISVTKSVFMAGYLVAVLVFGQVADKIGRRPVMIICAVILLLSGLVCAFSVSFTMFVVSRFFIALGSSGLITTGFVILMEIVGIGHRSVVGIGSALGWSTGYVILPALAYFIPQWFWLQIAITLPCVLLLILWTLIPESPRWLLTQGKRNKAQQIMTNIAKRNGKSVNDVEDAVVNFCKQYKEDEEGKVNSSNILDLVRTPGLWQKTINLFFNWFVNAFIYYGITYNTNDLGGSASLNFLISGAVEFPSVVITMYIIKKIGRRVPLMAFMVSGGISCILIFPVPEEMMWLRITLAMLGKFFVCCSFDTVYVYSAEIYPTVLRNIGIGISSMFGRLGSILAPFVRELGTATHHSVPYLCFGGLSIASGVLVLLLPETNNRKIPDTVEEAAMFGRKDKKENCALKNTGSPSGDQIALSCVKGFPGEQQPDYRSIQSVSTPEENQT